MREVECAKCGKTKEKIGGYDPDKGWLCPSCWEISSSPSDSENDKT